MFHINFKLISKKILLTLLFLGPIAITVIFAQPPPPPPPPPPPAGVPIDGGVAILLAGLGLYGAKKYRDQNKTEV